MSSSYIHFPALAAGLLLAAGLDSCAQRVWSSRIRLSFQASSLRQPYLWRQHGPAARQAEHHLGLI